MYPYNIGNYISPDWSLANQAVTQVAAGMPGPSRDLMLLNLRIAQELSAKTNANNDNWNGSFATANGMFNPQQPPSNVLSSGYTQPGLQSPPTAGAAPNALNGVQGYSANNNGFTNCIPQPPAQNTAFPGQGSAIPSANPQQQSLFSESPFSTDRMRFLLNTALGYFFIPPIVQQRFEPLDPMALAQAWQQQQQQFQQYPNTQNHVPFVLPQRQTLNQLPPGALP
jgi:hypothetical protein